MVFTCLTDTSTMVKDPDILFAKLNIETAKIPWRELQRFFAQGKVLIVNPDQDLVAIARHIAADQSDEINRLINDSVINLVTDDQAQAMIDDDSLVWAVVTAPWVLIQQIEAIQLARHQDFGTGSEKFDPDSGH